MPLSVFNTKQDVFAEHLCPNSNTCNVQKWLWSWITDLQSNRDHLQMRCINVPSLRSMGFNVFQLLVTQVEGDWHNNWQACAKQYAPPISKGALIYQWCVTRTLSSVAVHGIKQTEKHMEIHLWDKIKRFVKSKIKQTLLIISHDSHANCD